MNRIAALLASATLSIVLCACSEPEEGTGEKLGKQLDQSLQDAKEYQAEKSQQAEEAMDQAKEDAAKTIADLKKRTGETMQSLGESMEKAGEAMQEEQ